MIHEYYNECDDIKIFIDDVNNTLEMKHLATNDSELYNITAAWVTEIINALQVPGFSWGAVMMKVCRAVAKKISGGSSAS